MGCQFIELGDIKEDTFGACGDEELITAELHHVGEHGDGSEHGTVRGGEGLEQESLAKNGTAPVARTGDREVLASLVIDHPELIFDDSHIIKDRLKDGLEVHHICAVHPISSWASTYAGVQKAL